MTVGSLLAAALITIIATAPTFAQDGEQGNSSSKRTTETVTAPRQKAWAGQQLSQACRIPSGGTQAVIGMGGVDGYASTADDLFGEGQAGMMGIGFGGTPLGQRVDVIQLDEVETEELYVT